MSQLLLLLFSPIIAFVLIFTLFKHDCILVDMLTPGQPLVHLKKEIKAWWRRIDELEEVKILE